MLNGNDGNAALHVVDDVMVGDTRTLGYARADLPTTIAITFSSLSSFESPTAPKVILAIGWNIFS